MKQILRQGLAAPLYAAVVLLLCFGSCQSSDNAKAGEGASVASLPLTAQIGETSSRVSMTDTYDGAFTCSWNNDQLNVYHKYRKYATVQSMLALSFATTAMSGTSATFSCTNGGYYYYNPGAQLYAFSNNAGGTYRTTVSDDGTSTLKATTLASQNGTLADCAKYDALYGSANVNSTTGLPESLAMHHLFGMMNLHLTSSSFSTSHPVTVKLTTSDGTKLLPDNSGNATLNANGSLDVLTGSWGTSWSATITPTTAGVVDVYFMTWPFTSSTGTLTVACSDASGYVYTARTVTLSSFGLAAAQLKSKPLAITNGPFTSDSSKLFTWDATDYQPVTIKIAPTNANTTTLASSSTDYSSRALYACKNCPNAYEITWYLAAGCYWDDGNQGAKGGNTTSYTMANGSATTVGLWLKKKSGITNYSSTTSSGLTSVTPTDLSTKTAADISALNLGANYFFLPAAGFTLSLNGSYSYGGTNGFYWSSSPDSLGAGAYTLAFNSGSAFISTMYGRSNGFCLWTAQ